MTLGFTQPITTDIYPEGAVGARALGGTHKLSARGKVQGGSTGADVDFSNLINNLDKYKADAWNGIGGLVPANDTDTDHDISIAAGWCADAAKTTSIYLAAAIVKRIDANWAVGTGNGGFPSGLTLTADTWYHLFLILSIDVEAGTYTVDAGFDTSLSAANLLSGASAYVEYRLVGSVLTDGSSNILGFAAIETAGGGLEVLWVDPPLDITDATTGISAVPAAISTPLGIKVLANCNGFIDETGGTPTAIYISSLDVDDENPSISAAPLGSYGASTTGSRNVMAQVSVRTNISSQLRYRSNIDTSFRLVTTGWNDHRR